MRLTVIAVATLMAAGWWSVQSPRAAAEPPPTNCDNAFCTPGITPNVVLGAPCENTSYFVYGTTSWGRLVYCGSPRRYEPRYFRTMPMVGIRELDSNCTGLENNMAQAPDGLFLMCVASNGEVTWQRGDA
ncbi:hypothetical protein A5761_09905 [Mycolicibacterium setense]|uniref:hypothetical protein n=1 Tax=Mycolicibacterium setense TaxID=431269 RepID=UPI0007EBF066|nr:hypothetical protein [Mycolicibacterium setense]OBB17705.1 hypothetical protein A5761_09905 [Mycolicibacterium setense]